MTKGGRFTGISTRLIKSTKQTSVEKFLTLAASPWKRSLGRKPVVAYNSRQRLIFAIDQHMQNGKTQNNQWHKKMRTCTRRNSNIAQLYKVRKLGQHPYFSMVVWMDPLHSHRINLLQAFIPAAFIAIGKACLAQITDMSTAVWELSYTLRTRNI